MHAWTWLAFFIGGMLKLSTERLSTNFLLALCLLLVAEKRVLFFFLYLIHGTFRNYGQ